MRLKSVVLDYAASAKARVGELKAFVKETERDVTKTVKAATKTVAKANKEIARLEKLLPKRKKYKARKAKVEKDVPAAPAPKVSKSALPGVKAVKLMPKASPVAPPEEAEAA